MSFVLASVILSLFQGLWDVEPIKETSQRSERNIVYSTKPMYLIKESYNKIRPILWEINISLY
jgi:hypothetical protein